MQTNRHYENNGHLAVNQERNLVSHFSCPDRAVLDKNKADMLCRAPSTCGPVPSEPSSICCSIFFIASSNLCRLTALLSKSSRDCLSCHCTYSNTTCRCPNTADSINPQDLTTRTFDSSMKTYETACGMLRNICS